MEFEDLNLTLKLKAVDIYVRKKMGMGSIYFQH